MKKYVNRHFYFVCDHCDSVAGKARDERDALAMARRFVRLNGWKWKHPHWGLICTSCQ